MKVRNLAVVAGSMACNGRCPFCIAKATPAYGLGLGEPEFNWERLEKAARLASKSGATTALITGKGEPTLFPEQVTKLVEKLSKTFPIIELQTNGILLGSKSLEKYLAEWHAKGLDIISLSISHCDDRKNAAILGTEVDLRKTIETVHRLGLSVRLTCLLMKGCVDSVEEALKVLRFSKECGVEQLSFRELGCDEETRNAEVKSWVAMHVLPQSVLGGIREFFAKNGKKIMTLDYGLVVYDFEGQNVGFTNCLTIKPEEESIRQLICFPDGHIRFDWRYNGATIM